MCVIFRGFFIVILGLVFFISCSDSNVDSALPLSDVSLESSEKKYIKEPQISTESIDMQAQKPYSTPQDIKDFSKKYKDFIESSKSSKNANLKDSKVIESTSQNLDNEFLFLRKKYKGDENALNDLKKCCACVRSDCSSMQINNEYFYDTFDILEAFNNAILDKNTNILSHTEVLQKYDYVLKSMQTTTIDLNALNAQNSEFSYIKFEWINTDSIESNLPNVLSITLSPKENICAQSQYNIITTFTRDNLNGKNAVKSAQYKEKLPSFLYPSDLVYFVRQSCACAMGLGNIAKLSNQKSENIDISEFKIDSKMLVENSAKSYENPNLENFKVPKDYYKFLPPNIKYCDNLESKRAMLWEKYIQDSRAIKILQSEQKMYKQEFYDDTK